MADQEKNQDQQQQQPLSRQQVQQQHLQRLHQSGTFKPSDQPVAIVDTAAGQD